MNCKEACAKITNRPTVTNPIDCLIDKTESRFAKEGPALDCVSDHETYLAMLAKAPFYVSTVHCRDGKRTWWAAAVDKEAYDAWEEETEHQHHPCEEHEHYLCNCMAVELGE